MIQQQTKINIVDNSGASLGRCIKILGRTNQKFKILNNIVLISILKKRLKLKKKLDKGQVLKLIILRSKKKIKRYDGSSLLFYDNAGVVLKKDKIQLIGTRVFGPVSHELRYKDFLCNKKIISLSPRIL